MASSNTSDKSIEELLPDFPKGPLTAYRNQASFDWRKLKIAIEEEDLLRFKHTVWEYFRNNEIFNLDSETLPLDEQRKLTVRRMRKLREADFFNIEKVAANPRISATWTEILFGYDASMAVKNELTYNLFINVLRAFGSARHYKFIEAAEATEIVGCFALTEFAHGSNAKGIRTTATYDLPTKQFILHSADFEAAKCWVGNLGKCATHVIVYAKLITPDKQDHGLNTFIVPVRCPRTLRPYAGVIVGDLGEKVGLNGVDNGFVIFNNYRIPAENLLNKLGDVNEKGEFVSPIKEPNKRFGASLGVLSGGRVHIGVMATNEIHKAITIAIRYSAARKQFGPDDSDEEYPVLEYQQQQFRLIPYLATTYAMKIFNKWLGEKHTKFLIARFVDPKNIDGNEAMELHAVSSASKPTISWLARDGIQVCREACGGHGYLKAAGIGDLRNQNDANCTYEGENSILIQQTSNWLLLLWRNLQKGEKVITPMGTGDFLNNYTNIKAPGTIKSSKEIVHPETLINAYRWLVIYYLKLTSGKVEKLAKEGKDNFTIRNNTQAHHAAPLSVIYAEHAILDLFYKFACKVEDKNSREVLMKLVSLFGAWSLEKHLGTLYIGKYFTENAGLLLREGIVDLCAAIKPDAVMLVDTIAPPDFIINSVLGSSDGNVYQNLQSAIFSSPEALSRPNWWQEVINWKTYVPSKF